MNKYILLVISLILILGLSCSRKPININDNFENKKLNKIWSTARIETNSYDFQSKIVRNGKRAIRITLKSGDIVEQQKGNDNSTERDELLEARELYAIEDIKYEYKFSMFLPDSFPIWPVRLVIAQWRQDCPFCSCSDYSPILALRYVSGKLFITLQTDSVRQTLYELNEEIRNRWLDFCFEVKFSKQNNGEILVFLNGEKILNYRGVTSYMDNCRILSQKNKYYFKMGLYRDRILNPMSIYIDDYSKKELDEIK